MIKAVIFDFDDTLCMTEEMAFELENIALAQIGHPPMEREIHRQTWGEYLPDAIKTRAPGVDVDKFLEAHKVIAQQYMKNGELDIISQSTLRVLDAMAEAGKQIMILTGRDGYETEHLMDPRHHIGARISHIYHKDNNQYHKPDPRTFQIIEIDHGLAPEQCVYVGDSVGDAAAATGAGLHLVITLESGIRRPEDFRAYKVDAFINNLEQLPTVLEKLQTA